MPPTRTARHTIAGARRRALGSAMTETVLVLPLVFVVLALLFFFGRGMTRLQRSSVSDRYEAWRQAQYGPSPGVSFNKHSREFGDGGLLNEAFFGDNADRLDVADRAGRVNVREPVERIAELTLQIASDGAPEGYDPSRAEGFVDALHARLPAWWRIDLSTQHRTDVPLYRRFADTVRHQHTVIDGDWAFAFWMEQKYRGIREDIDRVLEEEVYLEIEPDDYDNRIDLYNFRPYSLNGIYSPYYAEVDGPLFQLEDGGNHLARNVRGIYMRLPDYIGPQVLPELDLRFVIIDVSFEPDPGQEP